LPKLADLATGDQRSLCSEQANGRSGRTRRPLVPPDMKAAAESYADISAAPALPRSKPAARGAANPAAQSVYAMHAHGAVFAEVPRSIPILGQIPRLPAWSAPSRRDASSILRMVAQSDFWRMIWGVSFALHETSHHRPALRPDYQCEPCEYHVPVNADVPSLEALMIDEHDPHVNALGIKGVGEIGITGSAGALPTRSGTRPE